MKKEKAAHPLSYMHQLNALASVFSKVKQLQEIDQRISLYLDKSMRPYCKLANIVHNRLIFVTANSSMATKLRLESADLLEKFRQDPVLKNFCYIHCKITAALPGQSRPARVQDKIKPLSQETASLIKDIANSMTDEKLKEIMLKIASNVSNKR